MASERINCQLCDTSVPKDGLLAHIAEVDFGYFPHKCLQAGCAKRGFDVAVMAKHFEEKQHPVHLGKFFDPEKERRVKAAYSLCTTRGHQGDAQNTVGKELPQHRQTRSRATRLGIVHTTTVQCRLCADEGVELHVVQALHERRKHIAEFHPTRTGDNGQRQMAECFPEVPTLRSVTCLGCREKVLLSMTGTSSLRKHVQKKHMSSGGKCTVPGCDASFDNLVGYSSHMTYHRKNGQMTVAIASAHRLQKKRLMQEATALFQRCFPNHQRV